MGEADDVLSCTKLICSVNAIHDGLGRRGARLKITPPARRRPDRRAVRVRASAMSSDPYTPRNTVMPDFNAATRMAVKAAYEMAGLGPDDVNLVELHDCFATAEIVHYENLGLCADGDAGRLIDEGQTALGGRIPVNVSGDLCPKGRSPSYHAASPTSMRSPPACGERAASASRSRARVIVLTHVVGMGSACAIRVHPCVRLITRKRPPLPTGRGGSAVAPVQGLTT